MSTTKPLYLKPYTELGLVVHAMEQHSKVQDQVHPAYLTASDVWKQFEEIKVHKSLSADDVAAFLPMLHELEEPVGVPLTDEELWYVHGIMDWFYEKRPKCWLTRSVFEDLTDKVAALDTPPYW